jgi:hypothetical protein
MMECAPCSTLLKEIILLVDKGSPTVLNLSLIKTNSGRSNRERNSQKSKAEQCAGTDAVSAFRS